jgi:hypothetical protein
MKRGISQPTPMKTRASIRILQKSRFKFENLEVDIFLDTHNQLNWTKRFINCK